MSDPVVFTSEDLGTLIAKAEADAPPPPLPEGVVIRTRDDGSQRLFWCDENGDLRSGPDDEIYYTRANVEVRSGQFAPLRPTITEADAERAVDAAWNGGEVSDEQAHRLVRVAFKAAGIDVEGKTDE